MPCGRRAMILISGVGERKLEKYGDEFLEEIRSFTKTPASSDRIDMFTGKDKLQMGINKPLKQNDALVGSRQQLQHIPNSAEKTTDKMLSHHQTYLIVQGRVLPGRNCRCQENHSAYRTGTSYALQYRGTCCFLG